MAPDNLFAGAYLDRRAEARLHDGWLAEAQADPGALYVAIRAGCALIHPGSGVEHTRLAFLAGTDPRVTAAADPERTILLGWYREQRCLMVDLPEDAATLPGEQFAELRPLASELAPAEAGLAAYARALHFWHAGHRFCGRCGAATVATRAGHQRLCPQCGRQAFPRIDPAIIVLVHDGGERALLGRQASWPPNRYSTIAGFVEPGESLEDAVHREVAEETGVRLKSVDYHSSQPWPFPASLMLGFVAQGSATTPVLRDGELEDARWFTRAQVAAGEIGLPPQTSISRRLIEQWLNATGPRVG